MAGAAAFVTSFCASRMNPLSLTTVAALLWAATNVAAHTADSLKSFGGVEEPQVVYHPTTKAFTDDDFINITDQGHGTFRMQLRYRDGQWWDGDRENKSTDRQRAEVKVLGPRQRCGETFEYRSTWRLDPKFTVGGRFCHITQVKAYTGPDTGEPLLTTSIQEDNEGAVRYCSAEMHGLKAVKPFKWAAEQPKTVAYRLTTSSANGAADGGLVVSVNGDEFTGISKVQMYRRDATEYQPKWGLYRGVQPDMPFGDDWVEHSAIEAHKLSK
jgi:hypothetical protein